MTIRERVSGILADAERGLVKIAAEAGDARAYADAAGLMDAARRIQEIGEQTVARLGSAGDETVKPSPESDAQASAERSPASDKPGARAKPRKSDYPRFFREGDSLVKVGWSKSEGTEYEHKCPKRVLDVLVTECARVGGPGRRFVMDKLLPLRDPAGNAELPGYQAYVALAFLRHAELVQQHGRSGYSIPKLKTFLAGAVDAWNGTRSR